MKGKLAKTAVGLMSTGAIPPSIGIYDWRIIAGAAAVGAIAGYFGIDLARVVKQKMADRKAKPTPVK